MKCFSTCDRFIDYAHTFLGTPYLWGGDDSSGLDCSGYVIECLHHIGAVSSGFDTTANGLLKKYEKQESQQPTIGGLFFYMKGDKAYHVGICIGGRLAWSASGGSSSITSVSIARNKNAFIKQHLIKPDNVRFVNLFEPETGDLII